MFFEEDLSFYTKFFTIGERMPFTSQKFVPIGGKLPNGPSFIKKEGPAFINARPSKVFSFSLAFIKRSLQAAAGPES